MSNESVITKEKTIKSRGLISPWSGVQFPPLAPTKNPNKPLGNIDFMGFYAYFTALGLRAGRCSYGKRKEGKTGKLANLLANRHPCR
jgi:hypothetical protein